MLTLVVVVILLSLFGNITTEQSREYSKRSYVCPPNFLRIGRRCYYFSKIATNWDEAHFQCKNRHGSLAIVKSANQDRLIRKTLSKASNAFYERWLGGQYDWMKKSWIWASPGKSLAYQGFYAMNSSDVEENKWKCIIMDPNLQYRWNVRPCYKKKHFICHTKLKVVSNKQKRKLQKKYKVDKYNKLNEVPVPILPYDKPHPALKDYQISIITNDIDNDLINAQYAMRRKPKTRKGKGRGRNRRLKHKRPSFRTDTITLERVKKMDMDHDKRNYNYKRENYFPNSTTRISNDIQYRTYFKENSFNPFYHYPRPIVEEYSFNKEA